MRRPAALTVVAILLLSACRSDDATGARGDNPPPAASPTNTARPQNSTTTPAATPATSATAASEDQLICCITTTGTITEIQPGYEALGKLLVMEHPEAPISGEQILADIYTDTTILEWTTTGAEPRAFAALRVGRRAIVSLCGAVATSYPGQGRACKVELLRDQTDGPADPEDIVTLTFTLSLYDGFGDSPPPDDDFYVAYADAAGNSGELFFCGDDARASRQCRNHGTTYDLHVQVPRGTELTATVYRVSGPAPGTSEVVERFREIVDTDITSRAHFRYFASDPGGYGP
jgi:hypothetical protein